MLQTLFDVPADFGQAVCASGCCATHFIVPSKNASAVMLFSHVWVNGSVGDGITLLGGQSLSYTILPILAQAKMGIGGC